MFTKPPTLKSPSIRQPPYSKDVQKRENKTSPTTPKSLPKPNSLKITSNPKPLHQMLPKNSLNVNTSTSSINTDINKQSFASTVANSLIPKKDQALLIDIDDNIPHKDYIIAIGNLVQPSNILFASRISKGRLCIFLSSSSLVNNNQPIANTPSKLDPSSNTYNTPIVPTSTSNTDTSPFETPNIASEPTSPSNLPPTSSTTSEPTLQNLDAIPNSDVILMDIDQPTGNKRSLPDSFLTHSPPPSPLEPYGNSKAMHAPQNPVTPPNEIIEKKRKRTKNQNQQH
ncbi:hypothetical protein QTP88_002657 [Uroleucon formosanum]